MRPIGATLRPLGATLACLLAFLAFHTLGSVFLTSVAFFGTIWFAYDIMKSMWLWETIVNDDRSTVISDLFDCRQTFCGRGVAISIYGDTARTVYDAWGYKWWHFLPDRSWWRREG